MLTGNAYITDVITADCTVNASFRLKFNKARGFDDGVSVVTEAADGSGDVYFGGDIKRYKNSIVGSMLRLDSTGSMN